MARKIEKQSPTTTSINIKNVTIVNVTPSSTMAEKNVTIVSTINVTPSSTMAEKNVTTFGGQFNVNFTTETNNFVNVFTEPSVTSIHVTENHIANNYTTESVQTIKNNVIITTADVISVEPILNNVTENPITNNYTEKHVETIKINVSAVSITSWTKVMNENFNYTTGHVQPHVNYTTKGVETIKNNVLPTSTARNDVKTIKNYGPTVKINGKTIKNNSFIRPRNMKDEKNIKNNVLIGPTETTTIKTNCTVVYFLANETMVERQSCENRLTNLFNNINVTQFIKHFCSIPVKNRDIGGVK